MSDLVENPEDQFSHVVAHLISGICCCFFTITRYSFSEKKDMRKYFAIRRVFKKFAEKCHLVLIHIVIRIDKNNLYIHRIQQIVLLGHEYNV